MEPTWTGELVYDQQKSQIALAKICNAMHDVPEMPAPAFDDFRLDPKLPGKDLQDPNLESLQNVLHAVERLCRNFVLDESQGG